MRDKSIGRYPPVCSILRGKLWVLLGFIRVSTTVLNLRYKEHSLSSCFGLVSRRVC